MSKAQKIQGNFGEIDLRERVDFGEIIGKYALRDPINPIKYFPTSKGIIHYDKNNNAHCSFNTQRNFEIQKYAKASQIFYKSLC